MSHAIRYPGNHIWHRPISNSVDTVCGENVIPMLPNRTADTAPLSQTAPNERCKKCWPTPTKEATR